jgi:RND family efflux transporter MFP subunit
MRPSSFNIAAMAFTLAIGIAAGALLFRDLPRTSAAADQPMAPTVAPLAIKPVSDRIEPADDAGHLGVVFVRQSADIAARSDGALQAVYANLGDRLKAGDVIAEIDSYSIRRQLEMAEATLRSAQADQRDLELELRDAASRYQRREQLAQEGLISREDLSTARVQFDRAEAKLQAAAARVAEQTAHVNEVKGSVANTLVRAPFDGTVAARYLDPGAAVRFGTPIVGLIRPEDLWVRFAVNGTEQARLRIGTLIEFEQPGSSTSVPGTIEYVAPSIAATSQEVLVEARLTPASVIRNLIRPGATGRVSTRER